MADIPRPSLVNKIANYARDFFGSNTEAEEISQTAVLCPGKNMPAEVQLDSNKRIFSCTRLPSDATCAEACNVQLQYSSEDLPTFLRRHEGKPCSECGASIGASDWYASRANTDSTQHTSNSRIHAEPVCYACWKT